MKINKILIIPLTLFIFAFTGCEEDILEKEAKNSFTEKDVWQDITLVRKFVTSIYNGLGDWGISFPRVSFFSGADAMKDVETDNGFKTWSNGVWIMNTGNISPSSISTPRGSAWSSIWPTKWDNIRKCNIALSRIDEVEAGEEEINILKGEIKFLRARFYHDLISYWGGVPLITKAFELDDDFMKPRTPYEEVVDWILKELDEARAMVPEERSSEEWGRVNKGACLALKSNLLLYANSKLHDPGTEPSGPLYDYKKNTWQEVADAAKAVIDMPQYSLQQVNNWDDYHKIFLEVNSEIIFAKPHHPEYTQYTPTYVNAPNGYHGWGGATPTGNLVDAFQMANGKMINEAGSGYDPSVDSIYKNRELRFYANILYQGSEFAGRALEFYLPGGWDSKDGPEPWNSSQTGYNLRKHIDGSLDFLKDRGDAPWIFRRLAEMYLNFAEAQYFLGNEALASEYVNKIRNRVHLPDINTSGNALFKDIQHERRIELCFEGRRYFDVRRWMIADSTANENAMGLQWEKVDEDGNLDPAGELTYKIITTQERHFYERMYYLPIPIDEINKSDIEQNPGY